MIKPFPLPMRVTDRLFPSDSPAVGIQAAGLSGQLAAAGQLGRGKEGTALLGTASPAAQPGQSPGQPRCAWQSTERLEPRPRGENRNEITISPVPWLSASSTRGLKRQNCVKGKD